MRAMVISVTSARTDEHCHDCWPLEDAGEQAGRSQGIVLDEQPARPASSNCRFKSSTCCFRRSLLPLQSVAPCAATDPSRAAGSRYRAPAAPTLREAVRGRWEVPQFRCGAISDRRPSRPSRHRYAIIRKIVTSQNIDTSARNPLTEDRTYGCGVVRPAPRRNGGATDVLFLVLLCQGEK